MGIAAQTIGQRCPLRRHVFSSNAARMTDQALAVDELVNIYERAWNCDDDNGRCGLLDRIWTESSRFKDPAAECRGISELSAYIGLCRARSRGFALEITTGPDWIGDELHFGWTVYATTTTVGSAVPIKLLAGSDRARLDADGRFARLVGEWERRRGRGRRNPRSG
jgi:hypothetical protein